MGTVLGTELVGMPANGAVDIGATEDTGIDGMILGFVVAHAKDGPTDVPGLDGT